MKKKNNKEMERAQENASAFIKKSKSFIFMCFFELFKKSLFARTSIFGMLILNPKTAKHSQHIPLLAYHLNSDTNCS